MNDRQKFGIALALLSKSPPQGGDYIPSAERPVRGVRFRVVVSFAILAMVAYLVSQHMQPVDYDPYRQGAAGNWFVLSLFCGSLSGATAFLSFLFTGRAW